MTVSSSELSALEHRKLWCFQTLCWLSGERSLPIGLLVISSEHKALGELVRWVSSQRLSMRLLTLSKMNISRDQQANQNQRALCFKGLFDPI